MKMNGKQIIISNMSVMAYMNEQSEDHMYVCDSNSYGAKMCIEYFLNRSQICSVI